MTSSRVSLRAPRTHRHRTFGYRFGHRIVAAALALTALACSDTTTPPSLTTVTVSLPVTTIMMGETVTATAAGTDQNDASISLGTITWSSSATNVATVNESGTVTGVAAGTTKIIATSGGKQGEQSITVTAPPGIIFNEVESSGGTPGDWAELYNPTTAAVDVSGWVFKDDDDTHAYTLPAGTSIAANGYLVLDEANFGFGLGAPDAVRIFNKFGVLVDSYTWTTHAVTTYGRCPNATGAFITTTSSTKGTANDCSVAVKINEVESSGGTPGDWIELYNAGPTSANLAGFVLKDDDDSHAYTFPAGTTLAAGAYLVVEEASLGFGLGAPDAARLFNSSGALVDSYTWTTHATTTYGRCPNGTGAFATTASSTKGLVNACGTPGPTVVAWPGPGDDVQTVDGMSVFGTNMSGLIFEGTTSTTGVLWAVQNGPGTLYRLVWNGSIWTPDVTNGWTAGKALRYPNGTGNPDAEGVTYAGTSSATGGIYVATERNNDASTVSRNAILRFDPTAAGTTLTATNEWDITSDIPANGANLGLEAITWISDSYLTSKGFYDEKAGHTYNPAEYANHGDGLFFVGVEATGMIYAYALNHATNGFTRIASFSSGFAGVMDLAFDRDVHYLWAVTDDGFDGKSSLLDIDVTAGSSTLGRFTVLRQLNRPSSMPNINNEGFAMEPESACVAGKKNVYWSDDNGTSGHALRRATIPCGRFP